MIESDHSPDEVQRLKRRLARERQARQEAERASERGLRDLFFANQELDARVLERTAELEQAWTAAEVARSATTSFLANVSHQLRTPVNGIEGMLELLTEAQLSDQERVWLSSASRSAARLGRLVVRILTYVDLEQEQALDQKQELTQRQPGVPCPTPVDVGFILQRTSDAWRRPALAAGKLLVFENRLAEEFLVPLEAERLRLLFDELLSNAVDHADPGSVSLVASFDDNTLSLVLTDAGPGIPPATIEHVFQPFRRGDESSTTGHQGSGMGLALSQRLASALGFNMAIDSSSTATIVQLTRHVPDGPSVATARPH